MIFVDSLKDPMLARLLRDGAVGVLPTDTVYGIVARAADPAAVRRLYALKHREHKPGTTIAANVAQLVALGIPRERLEHAAVLWPDSVSVVIDLGANLDHLHAGTGSSPFRVVADPALRTLLERTGPLLTSSANLPACPPATNIPEARRYFGEQVDFYVVGPVLKNRAPSTIVRFSELGPEVLRQGAVPRADIERKLAKHLERSAA